MQNFNSFKLENNNCFRDFISKFRKIHTLEMFDVAAAEEDIE